jgi:putative ABC transport system permease protein
MHFAGFIARNLTRRPVRSALTALGLSVTVGSLIALLAVAHNITQGITETFERRGVDLVVISGGVPDQLSSDLDQALIPRVRQLPGVIGTSEALIELVELRKGTASVSALLQGWPDDNFVYEDLQFLAGRRIEPGERGKALLGEILAENLGKGVGDTIEVQGEPFEVVGVFRSFNVFENGSVGMAMDDVQRLTGRIGRMTGFSVRVDKSHGDPAAAVEAVRKEVEGLTDASGKPVRLTAQPTREYVDTSSHVKLLRAIAWMVSAIAVVIGVISMLNTMVMSVLERTQEIGILRAVGWPRGRVVRMVLGEAVFLGLVAAVVGTLGAIAAVYTLSRAPAVNGFIEGRVAPVVIAQGLAITVLIGLAGGTYPAIRAARLLPTEAIRHD